jgi:pilus assembly protein Flp/PilA
MAGRQDLEDSMKPSLFRFMRDESGATAIEYGLIAAGISVAIIVTVNALGGQLNNVFTNVSTSLGSH